MWVRAADHSMKARRMFAEVISSSRGRKDGLGVAHTWTVLGAIGQGAAVCCVERSLKSCAARRMTAWLPCPYQPAHGTVPITCVVPVLFAVTDVSGFFVFDLVFNGKASSVR